MVIKSLMDAQTDLTMGIWAMAEWIVDANGCAGCPLESETCGGDPYSKADCVRLVSDWGEAQGKAITALHRGMKEDG